MCKTYNEFLNKVLDRVPNVTPHSRHLDELMTYFNSVSLDCVCVLNDRDFIRTAFDRAKEILPFIHIYKSMGTIEREIPELHIQQTAEVLKEVKLRIEQIFDTTQNDQAVISHVAGLFVVVTYLLPYYRDREFNIWSKLMIEPLPNETIDLLFRIIRSASQGLENQLASHDETFIVYQEGVSKKDFNKIYDFIYRCENGGSLPLDNFNWFVEVSISFVHSISFARLVQLLDEQCEPIVIYQLTWNLCDRDKLKICLHSQSDFVQFDCLRQVLDKSRNIDLSGEIAALVTQCLVKIADNSESLWCQFLKYFNKFPVRYPNLQKPLGQALAQMSNDQLNEYVNSIELDKYSAETKFVVFCVNSFLEKAESTNGEYLLQIIFERWEKFMMNSCVESSDVKVNDVFCTVFDDVAAFHIAQTFDESKICEYVISIFHRIMHLNTKWFVSSFHQSSILLGLLSIIRVYSFSWRYKKHDSDKAGDFMTEVKSFFGNNYTFRKHDFLDPVFAQIEEIEKNFLESVW